MTGIEISDADTELPPVAWRKQAGTYVRSIRFEADLALRRLVSVSDWDVVSFDGISAAAVELQHWLDEESDDDSGLSGHLAMLAAKYRFVCLTGNFSPDIGERGTDVVIDRLKSLDNEVRELLNLLDGLRGDG